MYENMPTLKKYDRGEDVKVLQRALHLYPDGIFGRLTDERVKEYQRSHDLAPDGIVGPKTWAMLSKDVSDLKLSKRKLTEIIVHCTATKEGVEQTVAQIRKYHTAKPPNGRGWSDIGYHYVVYLDGSVHEGRDVDISGAHCTNHNAHSIGVVYVGGLDSRGKAKDTRTAAQKQALQDLISKLKKMYPGAKVYGHRSFANKSCPCYDAEKEYSNV